MSLRPRASGSNYGVQTSAAAHVQDRGLKGKFCQYGQVGNSGKHIYGNCRQTSQQICGVANAFGKIPAHGKRVVFLRVLRRLAICFPNALSKSRNFHHIH